MNNNIAISSATFQQPVKCSCKQRIRIQKCKMRLVNFTKENGRGLAFPSLVSSLPQIRDYNFKKKEGQPDIQLLKQSQTDETLETDLTPIIQFLLTPDKRSRDQIDRAIREKALYYLQALGQKAKESIIDSFRPRIGKKNSDPISNICQDYLFDNVNAPLYNSPQVIRELIQPEASLTSKQPLLRLQTCIRQQKPILERQYQSIYSQETAMSDHYKRGKLFMPKTEYSKEESPNTRRVRKIIEKDNFSHPSLLEIQTFFKKINFQGLSQESEEVNGFQELPTCLIQIKEKASNLSRNTQINQNENKSPYTLLEKQDRNKARISIEKNLKSSNNNQSFDSNVLPSSTIRTSPLHKSSIKDIRMSLKSLAKDLGLEGPNGEVKPIQIQGRIFRPQTKNVFSLKLRHAI